MTIIRKTKKIAEFGDFQTPIELAEQCCRLLFESGIQPVSILEPTCGRGNFLAAALRSFPGVLQTCGLEINPDHLCAAEEQIQASSKPRQSSRIDLIQENLFQADWPAILGALPDHLLVIGNPPWVTNSQLGQIEGDNLPHKSNVNGLEGIAAITGKSNFDISEWLLLRMLEQINGRRATLAVLCKTMVARKLLLQAWKRGSQISQAKLFRIDAQKYFAAAVEACWLVIEMSPDRQTTICGDYQELSLEAPKKEFGLRDSRLVADLTAYDSIKNLMTKNFFAWRSGVKHDAAKVFEMEPAGELFRNGLDEIIDFEPDYLYPMLKSSELAGESEMRPQNPRSPQKWMLITQRQIGDDTKAIQHQAPKTWKYLLDHAESLDGRASSIYQGRPRFAIFGVGDYSFSDWKVGVSGFYKKLSFRVIGPSQNMPVLLDDTSYLLACQNQVQAELIADLLNSEEAIKYFSTMVFWDAKRPITIDLLRQLDLVTLAQRNRIDPSMVQSFEQLRLKNPLAEQPSLFG